MKLTEIKPYIIQKGIERQYNQSLNSHRINSVDNMFSSSDKIDLFFRSAQFNMHSNIENEIKEKISYQKYYQFLSNEFKEYGHFSAYLERKAKAWLEKDPSLNLDDAVLYLLNVFVVSPVQGKIKEIKVEKKVREVFKNFSIANPTPEEDIEKCWDLKVYNNDISFYLQVKTRNFFYGLRKTSRHSFYKIEKAAKRYELPIFFVKEDNGKILMNLVGLDNDDITEFVELTDLDFESMNQNELYDLAFDTFKAMHKENNI